MSADAIAAQLEQTKLTPSSAVFAKKKNPGQVGVASRVQTNLAQIDLKPQLAYFKYDVTVFVAFKKNDGTAVEKEITKPSAKDAHSQQRKNAAVWVYQEAVKANKGFFEGPTAYDRCKVLFSLKQLKEKEFEVRPSREPQLQFYPDAQLYRMVIKPCAETFQVTSNDLAKTVNERPAQADKTLLEVLNLFCSQTPLMQTDTFCSFGNTHYLLDASNYGRELPPLTDGKYMAIGANKKVTVLEGPQKKPTAYVATEVKKTNFHYDDMPLFQKIGSYRDGQDGGKPSANAMNRNRTRLVKLFKNLDVYPVYAPHKVFPIAGFTAHNAEETLFAGKDGRKMSVAQYFSNFKKISISNPKLFMVLAYVGGKEVFYPVEVLNVAKNQRVVQGQTTGEETQVSIRASATLPKNRLYQTEAMKRDLGLVPENPTLLNAGIKVAKDLTKAPARQISAPAIVYGGQKSVASRDNAKWDPARQAYLNPANVGKWAVFGLVHGRDSNLDLHRFAEVISGQMRSCGMQVQPPTVVTRLNITVSDIEEAFARCKNEGFNFLMFVSSDNTAVHADIKRLEAKYQIVTQDTKGTNAFKVCQGGGAAQTIQNIVNKTNVKLGGVNYCVTINPSMIKDSWLKENTRMIFGFEMSHPAPLTKSEEARGMKHRIPSVLGYACNMAANFQAYLGDFRYVQPRCTDPMGEEIANILPNAIKAARAARNVPPKDLVMYFHGVSEGQYAEIATTYKKFIRKGLDQLSVQYKPNITLIAVSKEHNERFFQEQIKGEKAAQQNIVPGTVIDSVVVNPKVNEFYLMSHSAFQGTAKSVKYTVIDDVVNSMDTIETGTHALCFLHEIVAASVSMPAPLVVADRCAKRGAMVFSSYTGSSTNAGGDLNFAQLNAELTNSGKALEKVRYNA